MSVDSVQQRTNYTKTPSQAQKKDGQVHRLDHSDYQPLLFSSHRSVLNQVLSVTPLLPKSRTNYQGPRTKDRGQPTDLDHDKAAYASFLSTSFPRQRSLSRLLCQSLQKLRRDSRRQRSKLRGKLAQTAFVDFLHASRVL